MRDHLSIHIHNHEQTHCFYLFYKLSVVPKERCWRGPFDATALKELVWSVCKPAYEEGITTETANLISTFHRLFFIKKICLSSCFYLWFSGIVSRSID